MFCLIQAHGGIMIRPYNPAKKCPWHIKWFRYNTNALFEMTIFIILNSTIYIINMCIYVCYIDGQTCIYVSYRAGQTAGSNRLIFFTPGVTYAKQKRNLFFSLIRIFFSKKFLIFSSKINIFFKNSII